MLHVGVSYKALRFRCFLRDTKSLKSLDVGTLGRVLHYFPAVAPSIVSSLKSSDLDSFDPKEAPGL